MMRRTPIVPATIGALTGAILLGAIGLWLLAPEDTSPGASLPTAGANGPVGPRDVPWAFASQLPPDGGPGSFMLQAGVLGEDRPRIDIEVPWVVDTAIDLARTPAVARPAAGVIVFVSDDGTTSTVHRVALRPGAAPEALLELTDAVWSIAAAPDGSTAYLALAARGEPQTDRGVVRIALDGFGRIEPFLEPVAVMDSPAIRLAAIAHFATTLDISADGRFLARTACRGAAGCETSLIEIASGAIHDFPDGTGLVDPGLGGVILVEECRQVACFTRAVHLESGARTELQSAGFDTTLTSVGGRPVVLGIEPMDDGGAVLVASDPWSGARRELHRVPAGEWLMLGNRGHLIPVVDGAALVVEMTQDGKAVHERYLLIAIEGAGSIEYPPPAIRPVPAPGLNG